MGKVIVFTSGKGGVGKTTTCAGVGAAMASMGLKVVLVDADIGLNNLDILMGIENKVIYDMIDVIEGKCRLKQALISDMYLSNLNVLPSSKAVDSDVVTTESFTSLINKLSYYFDYVLIDCPAGIEYGFHRAVNCADEAVLVTTSHTSAIRDADKVITLLQSYNKKIRGLIINRIRGDLVMRGEMISYHDMQKLLHTKVIGTIPEDDDLVMYSQLGRILEMDTKAGKAFRYTAKNIHLGGIQLYDCTSKYRGIMGKLKIKLRRDL